MRSLIRTFQRLLANPQKTLYVVAGQQYQPFAEPPYPTDPRAYGYDPGECLPVSPERFPPLQWEQPDRPIERPPTVMMAFRIPADAVDFAYSCNLDGVWVSCQIRKDGGWVASDDQSAFDIDW